MIRGERNLPTLISRLQAEKDPDIFVFCVVGEAAIPERIRPLGLFREAEGVTLILRREEAIRQGIRYNYPCARITLKIHSDLDAVGLLAAVTRELATAGISCNVVSACFHDHLFVPIDRADDALAVLQALQEGKRG